MQESCDSESLRLQGGTQTAVQLNGEAPSVRDDHAGSIERELLARGIRVTDQRRAILRAIGLAPHCGNVGVILRRAQRLNPRINRATVYRTVALLKRHGVVSACGLAGTCRLQASSPAAVSGNQVRMRCLSCAKAIEFDCCMLGELAKFFEKDCYFRIATAQLDIRGYCRECRT